MKRALLLSMFLIACGGNESEISADANGAIGEPTEDGDASMQATTLRVDVLPPSGLVDRSGDPIDIPPHTFTTAARSDLQALLLPAVELHGYATGYATTPYAPTASLPGTDGGVLASIMLRKPNTVMGTTVRTEDDGFYLATAAPGMYELAIVPDDPAYPLYTEAGLDLVETVARDIDIGSGHPVWGRVLNEGGAPLADVEVKLLTVLGTEGPSTFTDAQGRYTLHAGQGTYHLVAEGRNNGRDPQLTSVEFELGPSGMPLDIAYGSLDLVSVGGRLVRTTGSGVGNATVRLVSETLSGYAGIDAQVTVDVPADSAGNFDARVVSGTYRVELLPPAEVGLSPVSLGSLDLTGPQDLGTVSLPGLVPLSGVAVDEIGAPLPFATLRATEAAFERRYFTVQTDAEGRFDIDVPAVDLNLLLTPPADRTDLAATRQRQSIGNLDDDNFQVAAVSGEAMTGMVEWNDGERDLPLAFAVVQIYADDGSPLGQALTNADGEYSLQVDLSAYE